jgi:hypothetical protein
MGKNEINLNRLSYFISRQATLNFHPVLIAAGAIFGLLLVISLLVAYFNPEDLGNLKGLYQSVYFIGGYILTSKIFYELNSPQRSYFLLTLPVSTLEKIIGSWVLTSLGYTIIYGVFIFLISLITTLVSGGYNFLADIYDRQYFTEIGIFLVTQSIFFLGACYFRNNNFLKTLLAVIIFVLIIGIYSGSLGWLLFSGEKENDLNVSGDFKLSTERFAELASHIFFWYVFAPFMLVVSYFSLKERQV